MQQRSHAGADSRDFRASLAGAPGAALLCAAAGAASAAPMKNIVLLHGAWVDGSGWKPVYEILVKDGYRVSVFREPLTSLAEDVAASRPTRRC